MTLKHKISGRKTIRLVWLLMITGVILGVVLLGMNFYTLSKIRAKVQQHETLRVKVRIKTQQFNDLLAQYEKTALALLEGQEKIIPDNWFEQFQENMEQLQQIPKDLEFADAPDSLTNDLKYMEDKTASLKKLYEECLQWCRESQMLTSEIVAQQNAMESALHRLSGIVDKEEGKQLLKQAFAIYHLREAPNEPSRQEVSDVLSSLNLIKSDSRQDISDVRLYCRQLHTANNTSELINIKDNLLSQALARLEIEVHQLQHRQTYSTEDAPEVLDHLFETFTNCLFGCGMTRNNDRQIIPGEGGYYNLMMHSIEVQDHKKQLASLLNQMVTTMGKDQNAVLENAKIISTQLAQNAQTLLVNTWNSMFAVCATACIFFFSIAFRIVCAVKEQIKTISDSNYQLQQVNEQLHTEVGHRRQTEKKLSETLKNLEHANNAKSEFLANMSHEIRTPMNSIMGFAEILQTEELCEEHMEYVNTILINSRCLLQIINDILDYSKIEAGYLELEIIECSMKEQLLILDSILRNKAEEKELEFFITCQDDVPERFITDPTRINQCLINLVNNAIKFTQKGHVGIRVRVEDGHEMPMICFDVEDTGIGIPPEDKDKVLRKFTQVDSSTTRKYGGTGLGLAITNSLAELLGGYLSITSEVGDGSTFSLCIPLKVPESNTNQPPEDTNTQQIDELDLSQLKFSGNILVAEDVEANQRLIEYWLTQVGFEVTLVDDGQKAIEQALTNTYDMIFMDIQMPVLSGGEATKALKEQGLQTPVIALTASAMKKEREYCYSMGCDGFLPKPLSRESLMRVLAEYFQTVS